MPSNTRIPKAELTGIYGAIVKRMSRRMLGDIAASVDKTPAAVRQIAHRAREHVAARRPRIEVDRAEREQVVDRFLDAVQTGDLEGLLAVLAPDVVMVADGGGEVPAVRHPMAGRERVAKL